jgi:hypothetical protein
VEPQQTLVVGVGEVGGPLATILESAGPVARLDIEPRDIAGPIGVMHLCFPFKSRGQFVRAAVEYIERFRPLLTIVNSTVLPGTTRAIAERSQTRVAYSPVRGKHARMLEDMKRYLKFVAAADAAGGDDAERHFQRAGFRTQRIERPETLELAKLAETTYFGLQIAFAQELNRYASTVGADYEQSTSFFEEVGFLPPVRYYPGFIGGHCVVPNLKLLAEIRKAPLFEAILSSNDLRARELGLDSTDAPSGATKRGATRSR